MVRTVPRRRRTSTSPSASHPQAGFTLVEAMIAGTLGMLLLLPVYALLRNTTATAFVLTSRFQRNAEARQMLTMIGEGSSGTGDDTNFVRGLRSLGSVPVNFASNQNGQLVINDMSRIIGGVGLPISIGGDQTPALTIACTAPATPVPACTAAGSSVTTGGWLGSSPTLSSPLSGRTATASVTVVDPYQAARPRQTGASAVDTYRSQFNLNIQ